jgi:hypothetical protein
MDRIITLTVALLPPLSGPAVGLTDAEQHQLSMTGWPRFDNPEFLTAYRSAIAGDLNTAKINFDRAVKANRSQCQKEVALSGSRASDYVLTVRKSIHRGQLRPDAFTRRFDLEMERFSSFGYDTPDSCLD